VDLDVHRVVDLLPDRAVESFSEWLKQHPEIATISRDRCGLYADGATLGAPQSQQIADRFHLILNLSATIERVLEERSRQLVLPPAADTVTGADLVLSSPDVLAASALETGRCATTVEWSFSPCASRGRWLPATGRS
jgi:hypothetical protein